MLAGGLYLTLGAWGLRGAIWVLIAAAIVSYLILLPGVRRYLPAAMKVELATTLVFWSGSAAALLLRAAL